MGWFEDIPNAFGSMMLLISLVSAMFFVISIDFSDTTKTNENVDNTLGYMVDSATPSEFGPMSWLVEHVKNPWLLLVGFLFILWIFGYLKK